MGRRIVCIKYLSHPGRNEFVDGFATHIQSLTGFLFNYFCKLNIPDTTRLADWNLLSHQNVLKALLPIFNPGGIVFFIENRIPRSGSTLARVVCSLSVNVSMNIRPLCGRKC